MDISGFKPPVLLKRLEQALAEADWERRDVLVGCLRNRSQLSVCLRHGFYHMPVERLEGDAYDLRYIAIYQSQKLFGPRAGVRYFGRITGCETVTRKQITQIPRDSEDLYYRFRVERWQKLPKRIIHKELTVIHLRTTEFLLRHSREVPELFLEDAGQFRLYRGLKRLLEGLGGKTAGFRFGDGAVILQDGEVCIHRDGALNPSYPWEDFAQNPYTVFCHIHRALSDKERT